ncbi:substrate-binding domain-containing protein [Streptomyces sp. NPDC091279]|uniref:substrate-binding domain-containing protein n=1 Tax=unclassified Streptomyces TaxID=2593676 RepID=UPI00380DD8AD
MDWSAARVCFPDRRDILLVALVIPLSGPAGIFGPSCELSAQLAVAELNAAGGVLDREVRLVVLDGGRAPDRVADDVAGLVELGAVDAVVGWHTSAVRQALAPRIAHRVPYIYTAQYEGGEMTPGLFLTGETDVQQLAPAMRLLAEATGARRWCTVGSDYVWPRVTARLARRLAKECRGGVVEEVFLPLDTEEFAPALRRIEASGANAVLMLLLGDDAVRFNRAFTAAGLHQRCVRLSTHMDENLLLATGAEATEGLWATAGYFDSLMTPESLSFSHRYVRRFGPDAPLAGSLGESCFEGILLLAALTAHHGSLAAPPAPRPEGTISYEGPRGTLRLRDNHLEQRLYLARADNLDFDIIARL